MSEPDTADLALREQIARVIAAELACQDGEDVTPEEAFGTSAELTWRYLDQGEVDFGKIADRVLSIPALAQDHLADRAEIERLRAKFLALKTAMELKLTEAKINCDGSKVGVAYTQGVIDLYDAARTALKDKTPPQEAV